MAFGIVMVLHIVVSCFLVGVILIQGGRGGLGEALGGSGGSSLFGGGANTVMTKVTAIGAALFVVTCLLLAKLSTERGRAVIDRMPLTLPETIFPPPISVPGEPAAPEATGVVQPDIGPEEVREPVPPPDSPVAEMPRSTAAPFDPFTDEGMEPVKTWEDALTTVEEPSAEPAPPSEPSVRPPE